MRETLIKIILLLAAGLMTFRFAIPGMLEGGAAAIDPSLVSSYLDSEYRFLSSLALGVGGVFLYLLFNIKQSPEILLILGFAIIAGATMRVVSMLIFGAPTMAEIIPTVLEFVLPGTATILILPFIKNKKNVRV